MTRWLTMCLATVTVLLTGCFETLQSGEEYLGKWVSTVTDKAGLVIERNGENFLITVTELSVLSGRQHVQKFPAAMKDGMLLVRVGTGETNVMIDKTSGNLIASGREYKRGEFQVLEVKKPK